MSSVTPLGTTTTTHGIYSQSPIQNSVTTTSQVSQNKQNPQIQAAFDGLRENIINDLDNLAHQLHTNQMPNPTIQLNPSTPSAVKVTPTHQSSTVPLIDFNFSQLTNQQPLHNNQYTNGAINHQNHDNKENIISKNQLLVPFTKNPSNQQQESTAQQENYKFIFTDIQDSSANVLTLPPLPRITHAPLSNVLENSNEANTSRSLDKYLHSNNRSISGLSNQFTLPDLLESKVSGTEKALSDLLQTTTNETQLQIQSSSTSYPSSSEAINTLTTIGPNTPEKKKEIISRNIPANNFNLNNNCTSAASTSPSRFNSNQIITRTMPTEENEVPTRTQTPRFQSSKSKNSHQNAVELSKVASGSKMVNPDFQSISTTSPFEVSNQLTSLEETTVVATNATNQIANIPIHKSLRKSEDDEFVCHTDEEAFNTAGTGLVSVPKLEAKKDAPVNTFEETFKCNISEIGLNNNNNNTSNNNSNNNNLTNTSTISAIDYLFEKKQPEFKLSEYTFVEEPINRQQTGFYNYSFLDNSMGITSNPIEKEQAKDKEPKNINAESNNQNEVKSTLSVPLSTPSVQLSGEINTTSFYKYQASISQRRLSSAGNVNSNSSLSIGDLKGNTSADLISQRVVGGTNEEQAYSSVGSSSSVSASLSNRQNSASRRQGFSYQGYQQQQFTGELRQSQSSQHFRLNSSGGSSSSGSSSHQSIGGVQGDEENRFSKFRYVQRNQEGVAMHPRISSKSPTRSSLQTVRFSTYLKTHQNNSNNNQESEEKCSNIQNTKKTENETAKQQPSSLIMQDNNLKSPSKKSISGLQKANSSASLFEEYARTKIPQIEKVTELGSQKLESSNRISLSTLAYQLKQEESNPIDKIKVENIDQYNQNAFTQYELKKDIYHLPTLSMEEKNNELIKKADFQVKPVLEVPEIQNKINLQLVKNQYANVWEQPKAFVRHPSPEKVTMIHKDLNQSNEDEKQSSMMQLLPPRAPRQDNQMKEVKQVLLTSHDSSIIKSGEHSGSINKQPQNTNISMLSPEIKHSAPNSAYGSSNISNSSQFQPQLSSSFSTQLGNQKISKEDFTSIPFSFEEPKIRSQNTVLKNEMEHQTSIEQPQLKTLRKSSSNPVLTQVIASNANGSDSEFLDHSNIIVTNKRSSINQSKTILKKSLIGSPTSSALARAAGSASKSQRRISFKDKIEEVYNFEPETRSTSSRSPFGRTSSGQNSRTRSSRLDQFKKEPYFDSIKKFPGIQKNPSFLEQYRSKGALGMQQGEGGAVDFQNSQRDSSPINASKEKNVSPNQKSAKVDAGSTENHAEINLPQQSIYTPRVNSNITPTKQTQSRSRSITPNSKTSKTVKLSFLEYSKIAKQE